MTTTANVGFYVAPKGGAKEKLMKRLLEGNDDIFNEFVIVGLEEDLDVIVSEVERLMEVKDLKDSQFTDLNELYHDGKAVIRVLNYHSAYSYAEQSKLMNSAWNKLLEKVF